jgi:UDP-2,3-diacylglucosamine pyrophosphatase LpxH
MGTKGEVDSRLEELQNEGLVELQGALERDRIIVFRQEFKTAYRRRTRILQISDLHCSRRGSRKRHRENPMDVFKSYIGQQQERYDYLVVCGDLGTIGHSSEIQMAVDSVNEISTVALNPREGSGEGVVVVHGNHDANWKRLVDHASSVRGSDQEEVRERFVEFEGCVQTNWVVPNYPRQDRICYTDSDEVVLWAFNSAVESGVIRTEEREKLLEELGPLLKERADPIGHFHELLSRYLQEDVPMVTERAMNSMTRGLDAFDHEAHQGKLRIAVMHHTLFPAPIRKWDESEHERYPIPVDAGPVLDRLGRHRFNLILHGHLHKAAWSHVEYNGFRLVTIGAPSMAEIPIHPGDEVGFNEIDVLRYEQQRFNKVVLRQLLVDDQGTVTPKSVASFVFPF